MSRTIVILRKSFFSIAVAAAIVLALAIVMVARNRISLHDAVQCDDLNAAVKLLDKWGTSNQAANELFYTRSKQMTRLLIHAGARVDVQNNCKCTPLHYAAGRGDAEVVRELISGGARVDARDYLLETPLHWAANEFCRGETDFDPTQRRESNSLLDVARVLIKHGADVRAKSSNGSTPLHHVAAGKNVPLVELLLNSGANVNETDGTGFTPLHRACFWDNPDIGACLLAWGADTTIKDVYHGRRPADLLNGKGDSSVAKWRVLGLVK